MMQWTSLPAGWTMTELGEVLPIHYGKGLTAASRDKGGTVPVYGSSGQVGGHSQPLTSGPTIIIGRKGSVGEIHYSPHACWPIDTTYYTDDSVNLYLPYFVYLLRMLTLGRLDKSTAIPGLSRDDYNSVKVPIAPLSEQHRIVAAIEEQFTRLEAAVAALERTRANLKRYRAAVLTAACTGRLVPTEAALARAEGRDYETGEELLGRILQERRAMWEEEQFSEMQATGKVRTSRKTRYEILAPPETAGLPPLPDGWAWTRMPQLGELNRGKSKHRPRNDPRLLGGPYPFIQTGDVRHSSGTIRSHSQTYSDFGLAQSRLWPTGTLCITIAANIAETGILTYPACFPDSVVGFLFPGDPVTVRFIEFFLRTAKQDLERFAPATAQKNINLEVLADVAIPLPPLAEQRRVVAEVERRLSVIEEMEAAVVADLKRAERLRQAILRRAFAGQLVPQDPTDEPAGVLLARIKAERAGQAATTTKLGRSAAPERARRRTPRAPSAVLPLFDAKESS